MKRWASISCLALFLLATAAAGVTTTRAQDAKRRQPRVIQLEEIVIEGRVQKPNAFYILNRSNLGYEVLELRTSFLREVVRSVQKEPF
jgi:hypothetical protein